MTRSRWPGLAAGLILAAAAGAAQAQSDLLSAQTLHGFVDVRLTHADGEEGWLDGGFGKTSVAAGKLKLELAEAAVEWKPRFNFALSGVVSAELQPRLNPAFDLGEAYLKYQAPPNGLGRISVRGGLFYPPVSLEHDGPAWSTPDMLSASALNSWIGEEVKVAGVEASLERSFGAHRLKATAAVFGWNDTSGTLLSFRGWALHGTKVGLRTEYALPPLSAFMVTKQYDETRPVYELDRRAGYYGRLEWRPPAPVSFEALYYDNAGNRIAVKDLQWAWETRFLNVGVRWDIADGARVQAQAMSGETLMGYRMPGGIWIDMGFHAAYLLAARTLGDDTLSGRVDWFETNDRTFRNLDDNDEQGWALTAAWRHRLADHADFVVEALHVASDRPARALAGVSARQDQTAVQTAIRLRF